MEMLLRFNFIKEKNEQGSFTELQHHTETEKDDESNNESHVSKKILEESYTWLQYKTEEESDNECYASENKEDSCTELLHKTKKEEDDESDNASYVSASEEEEGRLLVAREDEGDIGDAPCRLCCKYYYLSFVVFPIIMLVIIYLAQIYGPIVIFIFIRVQLIY